MALSAICGCRMDPHRHIATQLQFRLTDKAEHQNKQSPFVSLTSSGTGQTKYPTSPMLYRCMQFYDTNSVIEIDCE